jgi:hypothetical protein
VIDSAHAVACAKKFSLVCTLGLGSRRLKTQVRVVGELEWEPSRMASLPERRSLMLLARPSMGSHECLQPTGVDELKAGQIEDHMRRVTRLHIKLTVKQSRVGLTELAGQPEDQNDLAALGAMLGADSERSSRRPLRSCGYRVIAVIRRDLCMCLVHACSKRRSDL